jgi:cysteinyl-tRNA synthetase
MSKSLGNFRTVRDISEKYDLQVLRFFMLSAHYRSPLNFSADQMAAAKSGLDRILTGVHRMKELLPGATAGEMTAEEKENLDTLQKLVEKYEAAMEDDFNTADAIAAVFEMIRLANSTVGETSTAAYVSRFLAEVEKLCQVLGIITEKKEELLDSEVEALIEKRKQARKDKNFALADQIRQELADQGILLEDTREGVKWKRA